MRPAKAPPFLNLLYSHQRPSHSLTAHLSTIGKVQAFGHPFKYDRFWLLHFECQMCSLEILNLFAYLVEFELIFLSFGFGLDQGLIVCSFFSFVDFR